MRSCVRAVLLSSCFAGVSLPLFCQSYQGGVRGLVTDAQGATVANAHVVLTDQATSIKRATLTNDSGQYVFSAVEPSSYTVSVTVPGFQGYMIAVCNFQFAHGFLHVPRGILFELPHPDAN